MFKITNTFYKSFFQWRSDDFRAPPQTTCLGPWPRGYGDFFFLVGPWRVPAGPFSLAGPPAVAGPAGPSLRHCLFHYLRINLLNLNLQARRILKGSSLFHQTLPVYLTLYQCSICWGFEGLITPLVPLAPQVFIDPPLIQSKIHQKYIADPPLVLPQIEYCIIPTTLLKSCIDVLVLPITNLINLWINEGLFP